MTRDTQADDEQSTAPNDYEHDRYTKLTTKVKRGEGTRDQDTTKVVTRHPDPEVAVERHRQAIEAAQEFTDAARDTQPGATDHYLVEQFTRGDDEAPLTSVRCEGMGETVEMAVTFATDLKNERANVVVDDDGDDEVFVVSLDTAPGLVVVTEGW